VKPAEKNVIITIAKENLLFLNVEIRINGSLSVLFSRWCSQKVKAMRSTTEMMRSAITYVVDQPAETPSERATRRSSRPTVKKKAPTQSTPEAREMPVVDLTRGGSLGITKIAEKAMMKEAPAITKKTTFQEANWEMIPPWRVS